MTNEYDAIFLSDIIGQIATYAKAQHYISVDDTIRTVAQDMLYMLDIATFENWKGEEDDETD